MKIKTIAALLLAASMCVALAACGSSNQTTTTAAETTTAVETTTKAEETTTKAAETTKASDNESEEAGRQAVEITADNWQDYFRMESTCIPWKNDAGETYDVVLAYYLFLKEGYTADENTKLNVEYTYTVDYKYVTKDINAGLITIGEDCDGYDNDGQIKAISGPTYYNAEYNGFCLETDGAWTVTDENGNERYFMQIPDALTINSVEGTIYTAK